MDEIGATLIYAFARSVAVKKNWNLWVLAVIMVALSAINISAQTSRQAPTNSLLVSATSVGQNEMMITGFIAAFVETPTGTHMTIISDKVKVGGTKLVYHGGFPFDSEDMLGRTHSFLVDRATNPDDEHLIKKMLVGTPARNTMVVDTPSYEVSSRPVVLEPVIILQDDEIAIEGTITARLQGPDGIKGVVAHLKDGTQATINARILIAEDEKDFVFVIKKFPGPNGERIIIGMLRPIKR